MFRIDIDQQGLDQQTQRNSKECATSTQDGRPDDQGQEAQCGRQSNLHANNPGLDDGLDDKIQHAVDHDDGNRGSDILIEQGDYCGRHQSNDEADVGNEVGDEGQQPPEPRVPDVENPECYNVTECDDRTENGRHRQILTAAMSE